ncbi:SDR family NAD(P)-dependent oxidoreductase, partial [Microbacterium sp. zg.Y909]|uniref:SDR family NAD(P)-dependent oxidoreductase n=1 Tax=Microbacterium sp. zg.Y909 TaxID=2969413 RepID=UPI00214B8D48
MDSTFSPTHAIVTASDSGIGAATAIALAEAGLDVGITWHSDEEGAQQTAEAVRARGGRAVVTQFDATDLEGASQVLERLADELGGVDVFVNNAGGGGGTAVLDLSLDEWRSTVALNLDGAFVGMQWAARRMATAGRGGRIVAITSVHEHQPRVGSAAYVAAKHGLGGLVKTMAQELGDRQITV